MQTSKQGVAGEVAPADAWTDAWKDAWKEEGARRVAEVLVERHARAPRASEHAAPAFEDLATELAEAVAGIGRCVPDLAGPEFAAAERLQADFLGEHADRLRARAEDGRVVASVADLRISDVSFDPAGRVHIGSLAAPGAASAAPSGSDRSGEPGDVCGELAGLAVDLLAAGRPGLAERLISHYAAEADDFGLYQVIDHHERRCALRRARRAAEGAAAAAPESERRAQQLAAARRFVALAAGARRLPPQMVVTVGGQVASGKSTLARALADRMGAPRVVADRARDQLLHGAPGRAIHETHWATSFEPGFHDRIYGELFRRARLVLASGRAVVVDGCFARARDRGSARALAREFAAPFRFVECRIDAATQRRRLRERAGSGTGGSWQAIADTLAADWQSTGDIPEGERIAVDTAGPLEASLAALEAWLPAWKIVEGADV